VDSYSLSHLNDGTLLCGLAELVAKDRKVTAALLAHLAEVDARKLYVPAGYPSMFEYCVRELHFSEGAAFKRIRVARAALEVPALFEAIAQGRMHLSGGVLLASRLTAENAEELLGASVGKTKAEIERWIEGRFPDTETQPAAEASVTSGNDQLALEPVDPSDAEAHIEGREDQLSPGTVRGSLDRSLVEPPLRARFARHLAIDRPTHDKLLHARALLRHRIPNGDLAAVLDRVLDLAIKQLEKTKFGATDRPQRRRQVSRANPRHIPAHVKRAVWQRDVGRCTFVSDTGHRCTAHEHLEFDHVIAVARGGSATTENIRLRCRAHNQYEAECTFGAEFMQRKRVATNGQRWAAAAPWVSRWRCGNGVDEQLPLTALPE